MATVTFNSRTMNSVLIHQDQLDATSLTTLDDEPNKMAELGINGSVDGVNIVLDADDRYHACSEVSGADVVDARSVGVELLLNTSYDDLTNITNAGDPILTAENNRIRMEVTTTGLPFFQQLFDTEIGATYICSQMVNSANANYVRMQVRDDDNNILSQPEDIISTIDTAMVFSFTAVTSVSRFRSYISGDQSAGQYGEFTQPSVKETKFATIADYDESIRITNQQKGLQTTALLLDNASVPESYNSTANTARVYDDTSIDTGFKFNFASGSGSIEESVSGELQGFGAELSLGAPNGYGGNTITDNSDGTFTLNLVDDARGFYWDIVSVIGEEYHTVINVTNTSLTTGNFWNNDTAALVVSATETGLSSQNYTATSTATRFRINGGSIGYSVTFSLSNKQLTTKTQRTEKRLLTRDTQGVNRYYINNIEQDVVPTLPDPDTIINLGNTAVIGYSDTITEREADFKSSDTVVEVGSYEPIWINFRNSESATPLPAGILHIVAARHHWIDPIIDTQNVASDITVAYDTAALGSADYSSLVTGDNSACMCDMQIEGSSYVTDSSVARIDIYLPAGTYDIQISSSSDRGVGLVIGDFTLGSLGTIQLDGSDGIDCGGWTDVVSTGETIQLSYVKDASSTYGQLSGLNIQRTA